MTVFLAWSGSTSFYKSPYLTLVPPYKDRVLEVKLDHLNSLTKTSSQID